MKKRSISLLLCLVMVFSLLPFGASAQVYLFEGNAIQLEFYRDAEEINTQRVLANGIDSIYDPGCPLGENEYFMGWAIEGAGTKATIDEVRAYVSENVSTLEGNTLRLTAVVSPVRYLVYHDESGRVVKTEAVVYARNSNSWNTDVNFDYIPADVNKEFYGWKTSQSGTDVEYENKTAEHPTHPTSITLSQNTINLYPVCRSGVWVKFDENDTVNGQNIHASYQPPAFIEEGATIDISDSKYDVSAAGYHFDGWYTAANGGTKVTNVSSAQTVYAHWTANSGISYKVAYWQQNANDDGYSLVVEDIDTRTGNAGDPATYDTSKSYEGFHLNTDKTNEAATAIAGDGSTIRNVYFDREMYELHFMRLDYRENNTSGTYVYVPVDFVLYTSELIGRDTLYFSAGYYKLSDLDDYDYRYGTTLIGTGRYRDAVSSNRLTYNTAANSNNYETTNSRYETYWAEDSNLTITARYGQEVFDRWPSKIGDYPTTWRVGSSDSNEYASSCISMPLGGRYYYDNAALGNWTFYKSYYLDPVEGNVPEFSTKYSTTDSGEESNWTVAVPSEIEGFTFDNQNRTIRAKGQNGTVSNVNMLAVGDSWIKNSQARTYTCNLHFTRNSYALTFFSDGSQLTNLAASVKYEKSLKSYEPQDYIIGETTEETADGTILIFQGWYDNDSFAGDPFDFDSTMPAKNVALYAKWSPVQYRVVLDANGGSFGEDSTIQFKLDDGGKVEVNNPTNGNLQFVGWYTDPALTQRYNLDTQVRSNVLTDPNWTEADEPTVRGKLTLYAKWRQTMDHDTYLTVVYDPAGGTVNGAESYTDPLSYADQAEAVAQPAAVSAVTGESFAYWEVMKPTSATDPTLVASGVTVKPGEIFNVKMDDAVNNTVTLRAHYEASKSTHIVWYGNGGVTADNATAVESADANVNAAIEVKPADTFTREGYVFLGWARLDEDEMKNPDGSWKPYDGNDLWLTWDGEHYTAVNNAGTTVTDPDIAANELTPHHVLYAVWEEVKPNTYVIDFGAAMKVATNTEKMKGANTEGKLAGVNGEFALTSRKDVTYQLTKPTLQSTAGEVVEINKAYTAADTAVIKGQPMGKNAVGWNKITTVPASSIYFDDDLATLNVGDGSGNNAGVTASPAENDAAAGIYSYKFYGTGIDIYCTTNAAAGSVQARLKDANGNFMDGKNKAMYNHSETERYNVPTICYRDLEQGEYTVVLRVTANSHYRLDGIRVYNAVSDQSLYDDAKAEQYAAYVNLRDALINGTNTDKVTIDDSQAAVGVLFVDNPELFTQMVPEKDLQTGAIVKDENGNPKMVQAYSNTFLAYKDLGPKNEIYLDTAKAAVDADEANGIEAQPAKEGQAITFTLTPDAFAAAQAGQLWIGLSTPEAANGGVVSINGATNTITVKNQVDQYYKIEKEWIDSATRNVTIQNTGNTLIAITNLKITGVEKFYKAAAQTESSGNEGGAVPESFEDLVSMVFEPVTMQTIKVAANGGVDPDAVKDNWDDNAVTPQTILKALFELLLNSLSRLFNGLGNW